MEVIVDELQRNNIDIDIRTLSHHINEILDRHEALYGEMAVRLNPEDLLNVFTEMNVNSFGRFMAYLTLVYIMNIPEDTLGKNPFRVPFVDQDSTVGTNYSISLAASFARLRHIGNGSGSIENHHQNVKTFHFIPVSKA